MTRNELQGHQGSSPDAAGEVEWPRANFNASRIAVATGLGRAQGDWARIVLSADHVSPAIMTELNTPLILEVQTENFVAIVSLLTCHGYRVVSRADNPSRHIVRDELPPQDLPPEAA